MPIGEWNYYHENGKLEHNELYNKYKHETGVWKYYDKSGALIKAENHN